MWWFTYQQHLAVAVINAAGLSLLLAAFAAALYDRLFP